MPLGKVLGEWLPDLFMIGLCAYRIIIGASSCSASVYRSVTVRPLVYLRVGDNIRCPFSSSVCIRPMGSTAILIQYTIADWVLFGVLLFSYNLSATDMGVIVVAFMLRYFISSLARWV